MRLGQGISGRVERAFDCERLDDQVAVPFLGIRVIRLVIVVEERDREPPRPAAQVLLELEILELSRPGR